VLATLYIIARIISTGISIITRNFRISTTYTTNENRGGTSILRGTINRRIITSGDFITEILSCNFIIITNDGYVLTSFDRIARISGTSIIVVTVNISILAARSGITNFRGTSIIVIAVNRNSLTSRRFVARIDSTTI
jgi:hypothetical protein